MQEDQLLLSRRLRLHPLPVGARRLDTTCDVHSCRLVRCHNQIRTVEAALCDHFGTKRN
jgi:hypothetical protein